MAGVCGDNRFEIIAKVKEHLLKATNIEMQPEELKQADNILFRLWQLGYFNQSELEKENAELKEGDKRKMKNFILGIIVTLIIGAWVTLAVVGVISVKTAILVPVGIVIGLLIAVWLFGLLWHR